MPSIAIRNDKDEKKTKPIKRPAAKKVVSKKATARKPLKIAAVKKKPKKSAAVKRKA